MIQNHMLQVVGFLAMEPPVDDVPRVDPRRAGEGVPRRSARSSPDDLVRGQFRGYRKEAGVAPDSKVETFAAVRLHIDSWRWDGVPFFIRAGKCLPVTATEVVVELQAPAARPSMSPERDELRPLPPEPRGDRSRIGARVKRPGDQMVAEPTELRVVHHRTATRWIAYERLLGDAMEGDATLFARQDGVEAAWAIVEPILGDATPVHEYEPGTWGPPEADGARRRGRRLARASRRWPGRMM